MNVLLQTKPIEHKLLMEFHEKSNEKCRKYLRDSCFGDNTKYMEDLAV
jgi:hypothetical protein